MRQLIGRNETRLVSPNNTEKISMSALWRRVVQLFTYVQRNVLLLCGTPPLLQSVGKVNFCAGTCCANKSWYNNSVWVTKFITDDDQGLNQSKIPHKIQITCTHSTWRAPRRRSVRVVSSSVGPVSLWDSVRMFTQKEMCSDLSHAVDLRHSSAMSCNEIFFQNVVTYLIEVYNRNSHTSNYVVEIELLQTGEREANIFSTAT
jgi:hypothetical protein